MMNMPVIPASGFKCHVENANLLYGYRSKETLSDKIFCKCIIWLSNRKNHRFRMRSHILIFIWKISFIHLP